LAGKAKVNVAMISYYFGSKERLMETLIETRSMHLREQLEVLNKEEKDPIKRVDMMVEYYVNRLFKMRDFHKIMHREITLQQRSRFKDKIKAIVVGNFEEVKKIIEYGQKKKVFRKIDVQMMMSSLIGTISQSINSSFLFIGNTNGSAPDYKMDADQHKERVTKHIKEMLRSQLVLSSGK
jgi:AcrR family transcriptional regulator